MNSYPLSYIESSHARIVAQADAFGDLARAVPDKKALGAFETVFFNNLLLALEMAFVHRSRTLEKKDGNALNEVRMLANSLMEHDGILAADKSIRYVPAKTVLGLEIGAPIRLRAADFEKLVAAFFAELEAKFAASVAAGV
jgi:hypothetical protein